MSDDTEKLVHQMVAQHLGLSPEFSEAIRTVSMSLRQIADTQVESGIGFGGADFHLTIAGSPYYIHMEPTKVPEEIPPLGPVEDYITPHKEPGESLPLSATSSPDIIEVQEADQDNGRPVLYAFMNDSTGEIFLSAYSQEDRDWEANHIVLIEFGRGTINKHSSALQILVNVLFEADIALFIEE